MTLRGLGISCLAALAVSVLAGGCAKEQSPVAPPAPGSAHVLAVWPPARATGVLEQETLWAQFDVPLDPATVDAHHVFLKLDTQRIPISVTWDGATRRVVIRPLTPMTYARTHTVEFASTLRTADGGTLTGGYTWQFRVVGAADPAPIWPASGVVNESPVVMLEWRGTDTAAGALRYEIHAGTDSSAVATRSGPILATTTSPDRVTPANWPLGTTIYWAVTAINASTGDMRTGAMASFTTLPVGTAVTTQRVPLLDWGYVGTGRPASCGVGLTVRPDYLTTMRWNLRGRHPDWRLASVSLELGVDDTLGNVRLWGTRDSWQPCSMTPGGPPSREPAWGSGPGTGVGKGRLRFGSVALASIAEAITRGRAVDGFIVTSDAQRNIATSGTNVSFFDITIYVLPLAGTTSTLRMAPGGAPAHRLRRTRSLAGARATQ
jgi:Bacterial Ig-like domain